MTDLIFYRNIEKSNLKYSRFMLFQKKAKYAYLQDKKPTAKDTGWLNILDHNILIITY